MGGITCRSVEAPRQGEGSREHIQNRRKGDCWAFFWARQGQESTIFQHVFFLFLFGCMASSRDTQGAGLRRRWVKYPLSESMGFSGFLMVQLTRFLLSVPTVYGSVPGCRPRSGPVGQCVFEAIPGSPSPAKRNRGVHSPRSGSCPFGRMDPQVRL